MSALDSSESQWQDVFNIYDADRDGKITKKDFISAVRVLGRRYTNSQMEEKMKAFPDTIHYDHFYGFMCDPYTGPTVEDLQNALRAFDGKDSGELTISQLQSLLTTMGDKMPPDDAKALLDNLPNTHGKCTIADIVEFMTPPVPSTTPNIPELLKEVMREEVKKSSAQTELTRMPEAPPTTETDVIGETAGAEGGSDGQVEEEEEVTDYPTEPIESL